MTITTSVPMTDTAALRTAFGHYPSGVAALAATVDGEDRVIVASSFTVGVSMEPPLVMFAVQHTSSTWPHLARAERIGASVLAADQAALCRQLGSKDPSVRWDSVDVRRRAGGALLVGGAALTFECALYNLHAAGDHDVVVLRVDSHAHDSGAEPLLFHRSAFRSLR